ncbi:hypothetical protein HNQ94_001890 [Salirhabdus euzebyi]|uniref:Uncharacterized protein n=1 Tax=Salirhabdus euzebyi TaxID=394506 RepID=A0A841Q4V9_9BACI|nr:hypothetical protein [Salirhabdus euzebyi]MBB6453441.1 hypothetical protein [Salirhabdus euzebyi]
MKTLREKLFWIIPLMITLIGLSILYFTNLYRFTEPPSENWSREIQVGTMDAYLSPIIHSIEDKTEIILVEEGRILRKTYDANYQLLNEETIPSPMKKWDAYYIENDNQFFFINNTIINGNTNQIIDEADLFVPASKGKHIFYTKGQTIFELTVETGETKEVATTSYPIKFLKNDADYIMAYTKRLESGELTIFRMKSDKYEEIHYENIELGISEQIQNILFTVHDEKLFIGLHSETQSLQNKKTFLYVSETDLSNPNIVLSRIYPHDPITNAPLRGIDHFQLRTIDGKLEFLFRGIGFTYKETNENQAFNIYSMLIEGEDIQTERLSNTYHMSGNPFFIGKNSIGWKQLESDSKNSIFIASNNPNVIEKADKTTLEEYLVAFGMCIGMLSTSIFVLYLLIMWIIFPIIYLAIIALLQKQSNASIEKPIYFYGGVVVYIAGALLFKNHLFPDRGAYVHAPSFLKFDGNDIFFILSFAIIALLSVKLINREWSSSGKYIYFIGLQFLLYTMILGPYYL